MPELPPAPGVTRAVLEFRQNGQIVNNVLHFIQPDGVNSPDPEELGSRLATWWTTNLRVVVANTVQLTQIICTALDSGSAPGYITTNGLPSVGIGTSPAMPNNVTIVMSLRTALRGRSYRGRIYHVGLSEGDVVENTVSTGQLNTLLIAYRKLLLLTGDTGEPDYQIAVLSYYANNAVRPEGIATPAVAITSDGIIDSQRRRLPGRGR